MSQKLQCEVSEVQNKHAVWGRTYRHSHALYTHQSGVSRTFGVFGDGSGGMSIFPHYLTVKGNVLPVLLHMWYWLFDRIHDSHLRYRKVKDIVDLDDTCGYGVVEFDLFTLTLVIRFVRPRAARATRLEAANHLYGTTGMNGSSDSTYSDGFRDG